MCIRDRRKEGNSYVVCAEDGNAYIRGRRLLKPINHPQYLIPSRIHRDKNKETENTTSASDDSTTTPVTTTPVTPKTKKNAAETQKMPRRSPRNHSSSKSADTEIAARLTTLHIFHIHDGETGIETEEGGGSRTKG